MHQHTKTSSSESHLTNSYKITINCFVMRFHCLISLPSRRTSKRSTKKKEMMNELSYNSCKYLCRLKKAIKAPKHKMMQCSGFVFLRVALFKRTAIPTIKTEAALCLHILLIVVSYPRYLIKPRHSLPFLASAIFGSLEGIA